MVKIINPLGDVKVGKQGEAVYQRKYGEQIRRTVSPKRAISSEAQLTHRQAYRDALAWRSQLSLANRRYLEGYCIANGVVDGYGVALAWSRFALKLYLQKLSFSVIGDPNYFYTTESAKFEAYENVSELTWNREVYGSVFWAQTFTPLVTHDLTKIELYCCKRWSPGTVYWEIRTTSGGEPTGTVLATGNFDGNSLPEMSPIWKELAIPYHELEQGTQYAIVARAPGGDASNYFVWRLDGVNATYPRGIALRSPNGGSSWTQYTTYDMGFREYGTSSVLLYIEKLIHVRHPALLTVVHKRDSLVVGGYDGLSSLDGEYLTSQVGIDAHVGDVIEATTLPGIDYDYLVK